MQPLKGITVVALEHAIAAPFATRQLADLGARVIKIERPGSGDFARGYDQRVRGLSSHFVWTNRSKESLTLDVKQPAAAEVLRRLILDKADVLVQNLAPGAAARLGLSYDALVDRQARHRRLRHLGLWRRPETSRAVPRQEGLRPADPERGRAGLDHRHAGRTEQGGRVHRRHRCRHVRLQRHPGGAAAAPARWPRPARRGVDAGGAWANGWATRCTTPSTAPSRRRAAAPATPRSIPTGHFPPATAAR